MLTPQEIQDKKFEKAMFGGYDMGQIDRFLDDVLGDYTSLYKENATLKAKMRVLVDKIEEYRAVDEEMRKTLYTAQVTAKDIVDKAQSQADSLLSDARREADQKIAEMKVEIGAEQRRLTEAKKNNVIYINKIKEAMRRNIELMDSILDTPQQELLKKEKQAGGRPGPREGFEVVLPEEVMEPRPAETRQPAPSQPEGQRVADSPRALPRQEPAIAAVIDSGSPLPQVAPGGSLPGGAPLEEDEAYSVYVTFEEAPTGKIADMVAQAEARGAAAYTQEMETRFFEVELGDGKGTPAEPVEEGDTAKIYGDTTFTPKPRFDFSDIRFGKDYSEDDED